MKICSLRTVKKIHEGMFSRRGDIRSGTQASYSKETQCVRGGVFIVTGKRETTKNVFGAFFLLKT